MKSSLLLKQRVKNVWLVLSCSVILISGACNHSKISALAKLADTTKTKNDTIMYLYAGTYTKAANSISGNSGGIYVLKLDRRSGAMSKVAVSPATSNPSYLALHPDLKYLYAVNENGGKGPADFGSVTAFKIDSGTHQLRLIDSVSSMGKDPCYISLDPSSRFALVANYSSGNFSIFPLNTDGSIGKSSFVIQDKGKGPNAARQEGPHAHMISPDFSGKYIYATDLGTDKVNCFTIDAMKNLLANTGFTTSVTPGAGPRHIAFHQSHRWIYIVNELNGTIEAFKQDTANGKLTRFQIISTLPVGTKIPGDCADIHITPSGKYLYSSNRGQNNSIAMFSINESTGELSLIGHQSSKGRIPRNFAIDPTGTFLIVANQDSNNIVAFRIDPSTGKLIDLNQEISIPMPVCIKFENVRM